MTVGRDASANFYEQRTSSFGFGFSSGGGGVSASLGLARERLLDDRRRDSDVGSLIGGGEGVLLEAGRDLAVVAAEITSPADIALIAGRDLDILPGSIVERHRRVESHSFAGITASVGTNVVGAARRLGDSVAVFGSGYGDARYEALGMVSGVLQGVDAVRDLSNPGVSASLSIGASASRFAQQSRFDGVVPARIEAGGDLALIAGRDLAIAALQARAGGDLDLLAGRDLAIESALATQSQSLRHSATSASLGLDLGWSVAGGQTMGLSLSANHARGSQTGTAASHVDADLRAGERLSLLTGNDALIAGAQLRGREILLDIGGDLHVASRADTARLRGSSVEAGIGLNIGLMPGAGTSLNLSLGGGRERADSTLVNRQTSIIADERLDARIEGHTQLDGGLIAARDGDLSLDTGTFGFSDIDERARSDTRRATLNLGFGGGGSPSIGIEGELAHAATDAITRATVGEGAITIRDEDAQRAREEAGETRDVAALNRDLDAARETLRDERAGVRFYASDSSVRAAVEAGATLIEALGDALIQSGEVQIGRAIQSGDLDPIEGLRQIVQNPACVSRREQRGFLDGFPWLITSAYADPGCTVTTSSGREIRVSDVDTCISVLVNGALSVALLPSARDDFRLGVQQGVTDYASNVVDAISALPDTDFRVLLNDTAEFIALLVNDPIGLGRVLGDSVVEQLQTETYELLAALAAEDYHTAGRKFGYLTTEIAVAVVPIGGATVAGGRATAQLVERVARLQRGGPDHRWSGGGGPNRGETGGGGPNNYYPTLSRPSDGSPAITILGDLDNLGRPTGVVSTIRPESLGTGSAASPSIIPPGFQGQPANHARGHLLARMLGGAGDDARNLVTLFQRNANHPNMSSFERQVYSAVANGEVVNFRVIPVYRGNDPMPVGVTLTARGSRGFDMDLSIPNIGIIP